MSSLVLYNYFRSSTSYRVRIGLHFKNLDFEYKSVHLLKDGGEQHRAEYRQLNPIGGVPTLVHNGKPISQSMAILEYLEETFPQNRFFPKDIYTRAKVRQFCENINADIHPLQNLKVTQYLEKNLNISPEQKQQWLNNWISLGLQATERILENAAGQFCFGDEVTAADLLLVPQVFSAERFQIDLKPFPNIQRINLECLKLDAFQKAHPTRQPDYQA
ncbi:MAG: maleylacetoacetate isomerase [Oligoflexia bacterium]|nr:MAG: maleylacetoacetate isomerase [Oligoflexia bacterium]